MGTTNFIQPVRKYTGAFIEIPLVYKLSRVSYDLLRESSIMAILDSVIHDFLKSCQCQLFSPNFTVPILQPLSDTLELEFQVQTKIQLSPHHIGTLANCQSWRPFFEHHSQSSPAPSISRPRPPNHTMNVLPPFRLLTASRVHILQQSRTISWFGWGKSNKEDRAAATPGDSRTRSIAELLKQSPRTLAETAPVRGSLAESSIFGAEEVDTPKSSTDIDLTANRLLRDPERKNWGWLKKAAARDLRRRGRLSRVQKIAQTEKEHTAASHFIKTSMKKLAPLARQIMGKSVDDAITQMRFSPKKAARSVLAHLHHTRSEAIVRKGMKPKEMYIAQAWVGRGPFERGLNHRARGRIDMLMLPYTSKLIWGEGKMRIADLVS